ncbi:Hpt domain-containing protein [Leptobacterium flavescens]|uniref:Hpt domain-containing protein n=1 Tax=Leptobacterium flavescens TaxID=472055 RepID=A0A6P0UPG9_9FLAO|nr:Hpt domain-containing protein [Leptobacterium flavescens]NER12256.1 Hpt domain-containing protein [Leptobacterium flavescens]
MLYDLDKLTELSGGDEEFIVSVIGVFLEETPQDLANLKEAIANQKFEEIYQHAHKIKPNVDLLGMEEVRVKVLEIETQGKNDKDMGVINGLFPFVEENINKAIAQLKDNFGL